MCELGQKDDFVQQEYGPKRFVLKWAINNILIKGRLFISNYDYYFYAVLAYDQIINKLAKINATDEISRNKT